MAIQRFCGLEKMKWSVRSGTEMHGLGCPFHFIPLPFLFLFSLIGKWYLSLSSSPLLFLFLFFHSRPTFSRVWRFIIHRKTFLIYIKLTDLLWKDRSGYRSVSLSLHRLFLLVFLLHSADASSFNKLTDRQTDRMADREWDGQTDWLTDSLEKSICLKFIFLLPITLLYLLFRCQRAATYMNTYVA